MKRRELICTGPHQIVWRETEVSGEPGPREVRVRTAACGIKHGTEFTRIGARGPLATKIFDEELRLFCEKPGGVAGDRFPCAVGNWIVGVVEAIGPDVDHLTTGQEIHGPASAADWHLVPADKVAALDELNREEALLIDPAMFGVGGVLDANIQAGERVLITGLGAIGLFAVQEARQHGATVYASSSMPHRREVARSLGADEVFDSSHGNDVALELKRSDRKLGREACGVDVALECSGTYRNLQQALRATRQCGRVVTVGFYEGGAESICLGEEFLHNRLSLYASLPAYRWGNPVRTNPPMAAPQLKQVVIESLRRGQLKTDGMLSYVSCDAAIETIQQVICDPGKIIKLVIDFANS